MSSTEIQIVSMDAKETKMLENSPLANVVLTLSARTSDDWRRVFAEVWEQVFYMDKKRVTVGLHGLTISNTRLETWEEDHFATLQKAVADTNQQVAVLHKKRADQVAAKQAADDEAEQKVKDAAAKFNAKRGG